MQRMQPKCPCGSRAAARARSRTALVGVSFLITGRDVPTGCVFSDRSVGRTTLVGVSFLIAGRDVPTGCVFSDRSVGRITLVGVSFLIAGRDVSVALGRKKVKQSHGQEMLPGCVTRKPSRGSLCPVLGGENSSNI